MLLYIPWHNFLQGFKFGCLADLYNVSKGNFYYVVGILCYFWYVTHVTYVYVEFVHFSEVTCDTHAVQNNEMNQ